MSGDWNAGGKSRGRWDPQPMSVEEEHCIQQGIDATMRGVIADRGGYSPSKFGSMAETPAQRGTGWQDAQPLGPPPGQDAIERMVNAAQPHGAGNPLSKGGKAHKKE